MVRPGHYRSPRIWSVRKTRSTTSRYGVDPQGYIDLVFSGEATPANYTMLPPSVDGYVSDCSDYSCNVEKARAAGRGRSS